MKRYPELAVLVTAVVAATLFFSAMNPRNSAPIVLVAAFILLLVISYCGVRLTARVLKLDRRLRPVPYNGLVVSLSLLPVMLLALQSIGQLTPRDVITLIILFLAGYFYVTRLYLGGNDGGKM